MSSIVEKIDKNRVRLQLEVDGQTVKESLDQAFNKAVKSVSIPGFRKGRTPRKIFETIVGKESIYASAIEDLITKAYLQALEDNELKPIDQPSIDVQVDYDQWLNGATLSFQVEVDVQPEVLLGEYKQLKVTKNISKVTDEDVETIIAHMQDRLAHLVVSQREKAQDGDYLIIDFEGNVDGELFPGGAATDYVMVLGSNQLFPEFDKNLAEAKLGDEKEFDVTFPSNFHNESLQGKIAHFTVKVKEIKEKQLPELDDDFAKELGYGDAKTLEELRSKIKEKLAHDFEHTADEQVKQELLDQVCEASEVEIPDSMINQECHDMLNMQMYRLAIQGIDWDHFLKHTKQSEDQLLETYRPEAKIRVKKSLVLEAISKAESISVDEEEIDQYIEDLSAQDKDIKERYNNPRGRDRIAGQLLVGKILDFLVKNAQITEEIITKAEVEQDTSNQTDKDKG